MTIKTENLVEKLCNIVDKHKYLLLEGGLAVGKTFISKMIADTCSQSRFNSQGDLPSDVLSYEIVMEIVPIHPSYTYEDFVYGISINTDKNNLTYEYQDKVFLSMLKSANDSWVQKDNKKYFLILDDINRGSISEILGDTLALIEPHGMSCYTITLNNGNLISIPPNLYIIATRNTAIDSIEPLNYAFTRRFYTFTIESDYKYIDDVIEPIVIDQFDITPVTLYYRVKKIVQNNLSYRYRKTKAEMERYFLGHGLFANDKILLRIKHQIIPLLKTFVKENILENTANVEIKALEKLTLSKHTKNYGSATTNLIETKVHRVTAISFKNEADTNKPLINIISRIKEQGLLDDIDIIDNILFNPNVLVRTKATFDNSPIIYPTPGYLYIKKADVELYKYSTSRNPRWLYSKTKSIKINDIEYVVAGEMQPKEFNRWSENILDDDYVNDKNSTSPNTILFLIVRNYYKTLINNYNSYLDEWPNDTNISILKMFAEEEWNQFVIANRGVIPASGRGPDNADANQQVREIISNLQLLWTNQGELISWGGQQLRVEGAYKVHTIDKYNEFINTMEKLEIRQMILQGPPGTSKTYSTRELLKFIGKGIDNDDFLSNEELNKMQIKDYSNPEHMSIWCEENVGSAPSIAWDIVQFHPSYGYEDFVRGIEVSTVENTESEDSHIAYNTVNKILGKIALLAEKPEFSNTKFFLLVDEINRANLATVFGELIYGLEYRGERVATPYTVNDSNKIGLPSNLYIIGTMNTADKSIGGIDYAIRRRFLFFSLLPEPIVIEKYRLDELTLQAEIDAQKEVNKKALLLFDKVAQLFDTENLNSEYFKEDVQIGHTYFLVDSYEQLYLRFRYQILPILREYYKDGMFQIETTDGSTSGWSGLLNCITGNINTTSDGVAVKSVFDSIVSVASDENEIESVPEQV